MAGFSLPWVVVRLGETLVGLDSACVTEMVLLPRVSRLPLADPCLRGVVVRRGAAVPVVELRARLGLRSLAEENAALLELLAAREQDHRRWLDELIASVREERAFRLTTDPHQCAFGRWYDHYQAPHPVLARHLRAFDEPHCQIHALASEVQNMVARGARHEALERLEDARSGLLARLVRLFHAVPALLIENSTETLVLVETEAGPLGVAVDAVDSVARIDPDTVQPLATFGDGGLLGHTCHLHADARVIFALDATSLLQAA